MISLTKYPLFIALMILLTSLFVQSKAELPLSLSERENYALVESEPIPVNLHLQQAKLLQGTTRKVNSAPSTSHTGAYHNIFNLSTFGDENVQLKDGSVWTVNPMDLKKMESWAREDEVVVVPNTTWFFSSDYKYKMLRYRHNESIEVNMRWGSYMYSPEFKYITRIDPDNLEIHLNDYSVWKIHSKNKELLRAWRENQVVIIGIYNGWFTRMQNTLMNVNNNSYVIGQCQH